MLFSCRGTFRTHPAGTAFGSPGRPPGDGCRRPGRPPALPRRAVAPGRRLRLGPRPALAPHADVRRDRLLSPARQTAAGNGPHRALRPRELPHECRRATRTARCGVSITSRSRGSLWLGEDASSFRAEVEGWKGPSVYTKAYEHEGHPVFQHEVMALLCRGLLGIAPATPEWKAYILSRRRPNGSFNSTPRGRGRRRAHYEHLVGTAGAQGARRAPGRRRRTRGVAPRVPVALAADSPGSPNRKWRGVDDVAYTWAALHSLAALDAKPARPKECAAWLHSLRNPDAGYGDRPGRQSNPTATFYALDALRVLGESPRPSRRKPPAAQAAPGGPEGLHHADRGSRRRQPRRSRGTGSEL